MLDTLFDEMGLSICTFFSLKNITIFKSLEDLIQFFLVQVVFFKLLSKMHRKNRPSLVSTRSIPSCARNMSKETGSVFIATWIRFFENVVLKQLHGLDDLFPMHH